MNISNLKFFDKNGEAYNLDLVTEDGATYWYGADYFLPISTALYDVSNIFMLEETDGVHHFPNLGSNGKLTARWKTSENPDNFFLYTVTAPTSADDNSYLSKQTKIVISESDFGTSYDFESLKYPLQINVAFTPFVEKSYRRVLEILWYNGSTESKIAEIGFYGEGEDEDERFRVWLSNFGVKFNREDAEMLRDYDLKEEMPDWQRVNQARKELLVNRDQIYPYVGTYKGLINLINLFGYRDSIRVKEYWKNIETNTPYFNKYAQVDITNILDPNSKLELNSQIVDSGRFIKTEFLALVYEFSKASDQLDADGLPEVDFTTEFSVNDIFYKLNRLSEKLKVEVLPINVVIKDVIGEFVYFQKLNLKYWTDRTDIVSAELNEKFTAKILIPNEGEQELLIRDIKSLFPKENLTSAFPFATFNISTEWPYKNDQLYNPSQAPQFSQAILNYYTNERAYEFALHGKTDPFKNGDDSHGQTGCPIVLLSDIQDLTLGDLSGSSFADFRDSKAFVRAATTVNIDLVGLPEIDGVQTGEGDRILVKNQTDLTKNGIYIIGLNSWIRTNNILPYQSGLGAVVFVDEGLVNANTGWYSTDNILGAAGSIDILFAAYTAETPNSKKTHHTIGTLKYRDSFETEWTITGPNGYYYNVRGNTSDYAKWPHILPFIGDYAVELKVYDLSGGISQDFMKITVSSEEPSLTTFTRLEDKFNLSLGNLKNVKIEDFGNSTIYQAGVNTLNPENTALSLNSHYLNAATYFNNFGTGTGVENVQIYNGVDWEPIKTSSLASAIQWGTGLNNANLTISDLSNVPLGGMYYTKFLNSALCTDFLNGFAVNPIGLMSMQYGGFDEIVVPAPYASNLTQFANYMNQVNFPGWKDYRYRVVGNEVVATAKLFDRKNHAILTFNFPGGIIETKYTFQAPTRFYSEGVIDWLTTNFPQVDSDLLFLDIPFEDLIAGLGGTTQYWIDRGFVTYEDDVQTGFLPSNFDRNTFDSVGLKITDDTIRVPLHIPVFVVMNNIDSKTETVWTLYRDLTEVARLKSTTYFCWRFTVPGKYYLKVETTDSFGNVFMTQKPILFAEVYSRDEYIGLVENELNRRMIAPGE